MDISKSDWKLFREKLPGWQEAYMERLNNEYVALLTSNEKAWTGRILAMPVTTLSLTSWC